MSCVWSSGERRSMIRMNAKDLNSMTLEELHNNGCVFLINDGRITWMQEDS